MVEWVGVDWGTTNVRCWGFSTGGDVVFETSSDEGMSRMTSGNYPQALERLLGTQAVPDGTPVLVCGMAGARQGWIDAGYIPVPAALSSVGTGVVGAPGSRLDVRILPGIAQRASGREDVMRGEETQILGLLALRPGFSGVALLPGTHSKWVEISDIGLSSFATAMTGELFAALAEHTVLRHSLTAEVDKDDENQGFTEGLEAIFTAPLELTSLLFRVRSAALLSGRTSGWCRGFLSGLLIGSEINAFAPEGERTDLSIVGAPRLVSRYAFALQRIGIPNVAIDSTQATIAGLKALYPQAFGRKA